MKCMKMVGSENAPKLPWHDDDAKLVPTKEVVLGSAPVICDFAEGWTYSRILKHFDVDSSRILHVRQGWLVFASRACLLEYCRMAVETLSVF